ncbi:Hypothetical predicted protein, partial [Paramuricea clavata]
NEECRFYRTTYHYVAFPVPINSRHIQHKDIFNGARPGRLVTKVIPQDRYNGAYTLNPFRIPFPDMTNFMVTINEAEIPPVYHSSKEAHVSLRQILDRYHSEMPFSYSEYVTDYGILVNDLSPNRDGYSQVLPNATSGNVGVKIDFSQDTAVAQQLICGEEENVEENEPEIVEDEITENELPENVELMGYDDDDDGEEINNAENTQSIDPNVENIVYDDDNDDNADELDEEALRTFMLHLFQLQKQNISKKKESRLIPSVTKFLKLDLEQKGKQITPSITRNL